MSTFGGDCNLELFLFFLLLVAFFFGTLGGLFRLVFLVLKISKMVLESEWPLLGDLFS